MLDCQLMSAKAVQTGTPTGETYTAPVGPFQFATGQVQELTVAEAPMARILRSFKAAGKSVTCHTIDGGNPTGEISGVEDGLVSLVNGQAAYHIDISLITTVESVRDEG